MKMKRSRAENHNKLCNIGLNQLLLRVQGTTTVVVVEEDSSSQVSILVLKTMGTFKKWKVERLKSLGSSEVGTRSRCSKLSRSI
jgi:hypothetical protein